MKLNNKGWGLGVFLGFVALFALCIVVASINAYKVGLSSNSKPFFERDIVSPSPSATPIGKYQVLESKLLEATMAYKRDKYNNLAGGQTVVVKFSTLLGEKYISSTEDCTGYAKIQNQGGSIQYGIFFKCPDYVSEGFDDSAMQ